MKSCELICNRESGKGIKRKTLNEVINKLQNMDTKPTYITQKNMETPKDMLKT